LTSLKGRATVISFWAPWCGPCVSEMGILLKLQKSYQGKLQIAVIAVQDSRLNVEQFVKTHAQYNFIFLMDAELGQSLTEIEKLFDLLEGIPVNIFIIFVSVRPTHGGLGCPHSQANVHSINEMIFGLSLMKRAGRR
jgi:thiol-disulfide isomerase/thioredoxin